MLLLVLLLLLFHVVVVAARDLKVKLSTPFALPLMSSSNLRLEFYRFSAYVTDTEVMLLSSFADFVLAYSIWKSKLVDGEVAVSIIL